MELRRLHKCCLLSYQRGDGLIDPAHQFTRMPPAVYWHWLLAGGIETASFSYFFVRRSKVRGALEIWFSVPHISTSNPKQSREFHSCSREGQRVKRIGDINERARLLTFRGLCKQRESQARPPG